MRREKENSRRERDGGIWEGRAAWWRGAVVVSSILTVVGTPSVGARPAVDHPSRALVQPQTGPHNCPVVPRPACNVCNISYFVEFNLLKTAVNRVFARSCLDRSIQGGVGQRSSVCTQRTVEHDCITELGPGPSSRQSTASAQLSRPTGSAELLRPTTFVQLRQRRCLAAVRPAAA